MARELSADSAEQAAKPESHREAQKETAGAKATAAGSAPPGVPFASEGLPPYSTNRTLRHAQMLRAQRRYGNAWVQRQLFAAPHLSQPLTLPRISSGEGIQRQTLSKTEEPSPEPKLDWEQKESKANRARHTVGDRGEQAGADATDGPKSGSSVIDEIMSWSQGAYAGGVDGQVGAMTNKILDQPTKSPGVKPTEATSNSIETTPEKRPAAPSTNDQGSVQKRSKVGAPPPTMAAEGQYLLSGQTTRIGVSPTTKPPTVHSSLRVQLKVNATNPAYPGDPSAEIAMYEGQAANVMVPEPIPQGFDEYAGWIKSSMPQKLTAVANGRKALNAAIAPKKAAIESALETDLQQGVNIEKTDSTLLQLYETNMRAVHKNAGDAGSSAKKAVIAGQKLVGMHLEVVEEEEAKATANAQKAAKAGETLLGDLLGIAQILITFAKVGPTGAAAASFALKMTIAKKVLGIGGLLAAKDAADAVKARWVLVKAAIARGGVTDSNLQTIQALQAEVAVHKADVERNKKELKKALDGAMKALETVELGKIDSVALKACEAYRSTIGPMGKIHYQQANSTSNSIGTKGWDDWKQKTDAWVQRQQDFHTEMRTPAQKHGADEYEEQDQSQDYVLMTQAMVGVEAIGTWVESSVSWAKAQKIACDDEVAFVSGQHMEPVEKAIAAVLAIKKKKPAIKP